MQRGNSEIPEASTGKIQKLKLREMIDQFDEMLFQSPLVYSLVIHPFIIGQPFRLRALRRAFAHIARSRGDVWIATPGAVAAHFAKVVPAPGNEH